MSILFTLLFTAKKNRFVHSFFGRINASQICLRFYLTFSRIITCLNHSRRLKAEICQIIFVVFLKNLRYDNFILKLSDLCSYCHFLIFLSELISNPHITLIFGLSPVVSDLVQFTLKDLSLDIQTRIPVRTNLNTIFCVNMIRKPWDCGFSGLNRMSAIKSNVKKPLENVVV